MSAKADESGKLKAVSMQEAVGYGGIYCEHQAPVEHALVLKHNRYFLITNPRGDIEPAGFCSLGLFYDDTRILSHYALRLRGGPPALLSNQNLHSYRCQIDLAVTDAEFGGSSWDPKHGIHVQREFAVDHCFIERLTLTNYLSFVLDDYWIELTLGCDFADIFEVRGWKRSKRGQYFEPRFEHGRMVFAYRGVDGELIRCVFESSHPPTQVAGRTLRWNLRLEANGRQQMEWRMGLANGDAPEERSFNALVRRLELDYDHWAEQCSGWTSNSAPLNEVLTQAMDDLRALHTRIDGREVLSAGIPWYSTLFGRDSIIASLQILPVNPNVAIATLRELARQQGRAENAFTEEEPGKILHEVRRGEMARSGEIPHVPYFGTIDATPLWVVLLHEVWLWTGDNDLVRELRPNMDAALHWIDRHGDLDGDGFVEYASKSGKGLANQGWKDSGDGVPFPDGQLPEPPIALVEVQGYVFDAKRRAAELYAMLGDEARSWRLTEEAEILRQRINERFWVDEGHYVLALDGRKVPLPTVASNGGHLLWSHVPSQAQADLLAGRLLESDMFCGWGIRTLSSSHRVFNPMSYHNGSVWPHDNALIALGMAQYGHARKILPVFDGLLNVAAHSDWRRLPELFCGMERGVGTQPVLYPVSCAPQAWASGALFMILQALLGMDPNAPEGELRLRQPMLPDGITELRISRLRLGQSRLSLLFRRATDGIQTQVVSVDGPKVRVTIE